MTTRSAHGGEGAARPMPGEHDDPPLKFDIPHKTLRPYGTDWWWWFEMTSREFSFPTTTNAYESLRARGVAAAEKVAREGHAPDLIAAWCEHADCHASMGAGAIVAGIRSGALPPAPPKRRSVADEQRAYGEEVYAWLRANLPDLRGQDPRVLEYVARLDGPHEAHRLAAATADSPHPTAVVAVMHLHRRFGRGSLTVAEHGPAIRAAVRAADERAIADYQAIEARRASEAAQPSRSRRHAPTPGVETSHGRCSAAPPGRSDERGEEQP